MQSVLILMSVYNGSEYLEEQLDSILTQQYSTVNLVVRDDDSDQKTKAILKRYQRQCENIHVIWGNHKGAAGSFFEMMQSVDIMEWDYFALSDQDDVWMPEKLERAVLALQGENEKIPLLYCSNLELTDSELNIKGNVYGNKDITPAFGNALVENICIGCTLVCNRKTLELIQRRLPSFCVMHDWWLYLVTSCFGKVLYDKSPSIYYRQHGQNHVGTQLDVVKKFMKRWKLFRLQKGIRYLQVMEFYLIFEKELQKEEKKNEKQTIEIFLLYNKSIWGTIKVIVDSEIKRQQKMDNLLFDILFLIRHV